MVSGCLYFVSFPVERFPSLSDPEFSSFVCRFDTLHYSTFGMYRRSLDKVLRNSLFANTMLTVASPVLLEWEQLKVI